MIVNMLNTQPHKILLSKVTYVPDLNSYLPYYKCQCDFFFFLTSGTKPGNYQTLQIKSYLVALCSSWSKTSINKLLL